MTQPPNYNDYSSANNPQGMNSGNQPGYGQMPVAPDAEAKLKRSQIILLGTAVAYALGNLVYLFTAPPTIEFMGETIETGGGNWASIGGTALSLAVFGLVYGLMAKRKKAGRVTGYVFAALGIASALLNVFSTLGISVISAIFYLLWLVGAIAWIVVVSNRSVSSILR
ncbi:hypothetical protein [Rothia nasisuis]|uniref:hypothetical protein n=1 Tax=Rothia nasisuis TaxID=2109647 RepID=UPI001F3144B0|nr:hypothetical protein [Rothia nasisuis]